jgi:cytosine/adenosine deaminase-related metal-dependent hydrolase
MQQKTFFRGPLLITFDPPAVEAADILVVDGRIARKGWRLQPPRDAEIIDARGRILCPGLVNAHVRLDASFARTLPLGSATDVAKVQAAGTEESLIAAAFAVALEAARSGTTALFGFHDSTGFVRGSLARIRDVLSTLGLRACAAYGVGGGLPEGALALALAESKDAATFGCGGRTAFMLGAGDLAGTGDDVLTAMAEASRRHETPVHATVGAGGDPAADIARLRSAGLLRPHSIVVALAPIAAPEAERLAADQVTIVRSPSAELAALRSPAPLGPGALGTDAGRPDLFEEARLAFARGRAAGESITPQDVVGLLAQGHRLASDIFKTRLGSFEPGSAADLVVLDYRPSTPMNASTLAWHVLFGMSAASVQAVMVDGHFVVRDRMVTSVDVRNLFRQTQRGALDLWQRAFGTEFPGLAIPARAATVSDGAAPEEGREPERRNEEDLELEPLALPLHSLEPWLVCQQPETDPVSDAPAAAPAATPVPASARRDTPAPKKSAGGFGAGIL